MCKKLLLISLIAISGCSVQRVAHCTNTSTEKHNVLNETEVTHICNCECPQQSASVIDGGGILGGLLSLFNKD